MKQGWKTTEFWMSSLTILGMLGLAGLAIFKKGADAAAVLTALGATLASIGYSISRAKVKEAQLVAKSDTDGQG